MSRLVMVRHGQTAGFLSGPYTDLTPRGVAQGAAVGAVLAGRPADLVVGPRDRHRATLAAAAQVAGWTAWTEEPGLDEHAGGAAFAGWVRDQAPEAVRAAVAAGDRRGILAAFRRFLVIWAREGVAFDGETWPQFMDRVAGTLDRLCVGSGRTVVAFTSAGFIGAATAWVVGASPAVAAELSLEVMNGSLTEVRFSGDKRGLHGFNAVLHLEDALRTSV